MSDLIERQAAIDIERNATVDTNPSHFETHQKFTQFMDDAEISSFGRWQWSNGFNTALTAVGIDLKNLPSAQPDPKWIPFGQSAENDEDRTTDDQIADSDKMIKLKKRTITERLIIANSLIAGAIADSDNNQFRNSTKMTDSEDVWEDGYCNYADRKNKDVPDTNVGDMISRQAAIDALERIFDRCEEIEAHLPEGDPNRVGYKMYPDWLTVWKYLHQLPSAQPEQRWIPCSERLPESKPAYYIVTLESRDRICVLPNDIDIARWDYDHRKGKDSWHWCKERKVIAWCELPEPYRKESE